MKVLVVGGTGTVGSEVVRELAGRGVDVRVLTRDPSKARLPSGTQAVKGELLDPATIRSVFQGMDGVFLANSLGTTECHEGLMAVNGARLAGVRRIAYLSVHHVDRAPYLPHFGSKVAVEAAIRASGMAGAILRPNNFFQNDLWSKDALLQYGLYPQPIGGVGLSRVDVRDIADVAAAVLTGTGSELDTIDVVGPAALTGAGTAEIWAKVLGKPIAYRDDLDAWEQMSLQFMPPWLVFDLRLMYQFFQEKGLKGTPEDIARQTKLTGHAPRAFEDFATETARMWKG